MCGRITMRTIALALAMIIAVSPASAQPSPEDVARKALDAALAGDHDTFSSLADETVRQAVTRETLVSIAGSLELQFGSFVEVKGVETMPSATHRVFVFALDYERAVVRMMVALDLESRVAGLRITGAEQKAQWSPPEYAKSEAFTEIEIEIGPGDAPLPGTLAVPSTDAKVPAVVLLHGSGPNDRDETIGPNKIFRDIAWGLASSGVATLRFEKRTKQYPQEFDPSTMSLEDVVIDDAVAAVAFLRDRPEIDPGRVFVLGHSLGGLAAPWVAKRVPELAGMIIIAGPGRPMLDVLAYQIEHLAKLNGSWNEETEAEVHRIERIAASGRAGEPAPDESILGVPASYWLDIDRRNAPEAAARAALPVLVIHGGRDYQVTDRCFAAWKEALGDESYATLVRFDDLNHLMIAGEGPSSPAEYQKVGHVDERVVSAIVGWISGE
jgi:dienelactone hydrolase